MKLLSWLTLHDAPRQVYLSPPVEATFPYPLLRLERASLSGAVTVL